MLAASVAERGYRFVYGREMRLALEAAGPLADWAAVAQSWDDLAVDTYLAERARFRKRRFAVFTVEADGTSARQPHQPHYQHRDYNRLFGGVERWFEPIAPSVGGSASLATVLAFCARTFGQIAADVVRWHTEVHQFRIEPRPDAPGQPTPEGVHRDGVEFVLVLLVQRENLVSGVTTVYDLGGAPLGAFTLTDPLDAALIDDNRVAHGVTPVAPLDPKRPACRDVLVVTLRRAVGPGGPAPRAPAE